MNENLKNILTHTACPDTDMFYDYIEGKLSVKDRHSMEVHMADCELCSDAMEGFAMISRDSTKASLAILSTAIDEKVAASKNTTAQPKKNKKYIWYAAASLIAFLSIGLFLFQNVGDSAKKVAIKNKEVTKKNPSIINQNNENQHYKVDENEAINSDAEIIESEISNENKVSTQATKDRVILIEDEEVNEDVIEEVVAEFEDPTADVIKQPEIAPINEFAEPEATDVFEIEEEAVLDDLDNDFEDFKERSDKSLSEVEKINTEITTVAPSIHSNSTQQDIGRAATREYSESVTDAIAYKDLGVQYGEMLTYTDALLTSSELNEKTANLESVQQRTRKKSAKKSRSKGKMYAVASPTKMEKYDYQVGNKETGIHHYKNGQYATAISYFNNTLTLDKDESARIYLALCRIKLNQNKEALLLLDQTIKNKKDPDYFHAVWIKAFLLKSEGKAYNTEKEILLNNTNDYQSKAKDL